MWALSDTVIVEERTRSVISYLDLFCLEKQTDKNLSYPDESPMTKYMNLKLPHTSIWVTEDERGQSQMYLLKKPHYVYVQLSKLLCCWLYSTLVRRFSDRELRSEGTLKTFWSNPFLFQIRKMRSSIINDPPSWMAAEYGLEPRFDSTLSRPYCLM